MRTSRAKNDENLAPDVPITKTIHHRNKSSPALSTMLGGAGLKAAAKRTAFGDLSNIVSNTRSSKDDTAVNVKPDLPKTTQTLQARKSTAFLRPAQRPLSVAGLKGFLTGTNNASNDRGNIYIPEGTLPAQVANSRKVLTKRNTTVFRDPLLNTVPELDATSVDPPSSSVSIKNNPQLANNLSVSSQDVLQPPPLLPNTSSVITTTGDPVKEVHNRSDIVLPRSSEGSLGTTALETQPQSKNSTQLIQAHEYLQPTMQSAQMTPTRNEVLPQTSALLVHNQLLQPHMVETALAPLVTGSMQSQLVPASLPQMPPVHLTAEPEERWDEVDEEAHEEDGYVTARSYRSRGENTTGSATVILCPHMTQNTKLEISAAEELVLATRTIEEIEDESYDTSMVAEYGEEIFDYMKQLEIKMLPNAYYMDNQHEIQWSMRAVLMDWLVQVHHRFNLLPETLFLTVNYIDRFLSCKVVSLGKLQLVGATAIFIAAKYEEINCPSVQEIVYMVDGGYTMDEVLKAERFMLTMLQFELGWPGPMSFLRRISKADDYDLETRTLAKYFLEVTIMDEKFIGSPPSFMAAAAHCLARMMLHKGTWVWHYPTQID